MAFVISTEYVTDDQRRSRIYSGEVFCIPPRESIRIFRDFAWKLIEEAFGDHDPVTAHEVLSVADTSKSSVR